MSDSGAALDACDLDACDLDGSDLDACGQAERVRAGEVGPGELVEAAIRRCERLDPALCALVAEVFDDARRSAGRSSGEGLRGPWAGVPFLMKDVGSSQRGLPHFAGNRVLRDRGHRAQRDSELGRRFREAGLVAIGISKSPEFGMQSTTQPVAFGPTHNPWDPERSAGGSSGGACAAVAAGLVPLAHASDGAGSIRIPAAWCGLVGLKPSRGRLLGAAAESAAGSTEFVVARSLRDVASALEVLGGRGAGWPAGGLRAELGRAPGALRIGVLSELPGTATHPECVKAAEKTAALLADLGHVVLPDWPAPLFDDERPWRTLVLLPLAYRACLRALEGWIGRPVVESDVEPFLWELADPRGPTPGVGEVRRALLWHAGWAARVAAWWDTGFDLLVTPTVPEPAVPLAELDPATHTPLQLLERMVPHMAFTAPFNATGQPAITLPLHWSDAGLPVGVQLVARHGREDLLLRVAAQLEAVLPWSRRRPPLHAAAPDLHSTA